MNFLLGPLPIYVFGLGFLLYMLAKRRFGVSSNDAVLLLIIFILQVIIAQILNATQVMPHFPDTELFAAIAQDNFNWNPSRGVKGYFLLSYPIRLLSLFQIETHLVFQVFLYCFSMLLVWRSWAFYAVARVVQTGKYVHVGSFAVFAALFSLYPAGFIFSVLPLREFIMLFGFCCFLFFCAKFFVFRKIAHLPFLGALCCVVVRPQLAVALLAIFSVVFCLARTRHSFLKKATLLLLCAAGGVIFLESVMGYRVDAAYLAYLRNKANETYGASSMTYGVVAWKNYFDILRDLPGLALQFLLSPLPILHNKNPFQMKFASMDLLYVVFILIAAFKIVLRRAPLVLGLFIVVWLLFSIWEFYIGGAVRHRIPMLMFLIPPASAYLTQILKKAFHMKVSIIPIEQSVWMEDLAGRGEGAIQRKS